MIFAIAALLATKSVVTEVASVCYGPAVVHAGPPSNCWGWRRVSKVTRDQSAAIEIVSSYAQGDCGGDPTCAALPVGGSTVGTVNKETATFSSTGSPPPVGERLSASTAWSIAAWLPRDGFFVDASGRFATDYDTTATGFLLPVAPTDCTTRVLFATASGGTTLHGTVALQCPANGSLVTFAGAMAAEPDGSTLTIEVAIHDYVLTIEAPARLSMSPGAQGRLVYRRLAKTDP